MRPAITFEVMKDHSRELVSLFTRVATSVDYKAIYDIQAFTRDRTLTAAVVKYLSDRPMLTKTLENEIMKPELYPVVLKGLLHNLSNFENCTLPSRDADFLVEDASQKVYFWIDERIEVTVTIGNVFYIAELMVDPKKDILLFNNRSDGWVEYGGEGFSLKVHEAYVGYIAEKQILKEE